MIWWVSLQAGTYCVGKIQEFFSQALTFKWKDGNIATSRSHVGKIDIPIGPVSLEGIRSWRNCWPGSTCCLPSLNPPPARGLLVSPRKGKVVLAWHTGPSSPFLGEQLGNQACEPLLLKIMAVRKTANYLNFFFVCSFVYLLRMRLMPAEENHFHNIFIPK